MSGIFGPNELRKSNSFFSAVSVEGRETQSSKARSISSSVRPLVSRKDFFFKFEATLIRGLLIKFTAEYTRYFRIKDWPSGSEVDGSLVSTSGNKLSPMSFWADKRRVKILLTTRFTYQLSSGSVGHLWLHSRWIQFKRKTFWDTRKCRTSLTRLIVPVDVRKHHSKSPIHTLQVPYAVSTNQCWSFLFFNRIFKSEPAQCRSNS